MSDEENAAEPSEIGGDLKLLALSLGFAWPEDEAGRWRVLKLMAGMASHWRAKYSEVQAVTWRGVERERMYQHMRRRAVSLAAKVNNLRRCLRDYMAGQRVAVAEARTELMAAKAAQEEPCPYVTGKTTRYCTLTPFTLTDEERAGIAPVIRKPAAYIVEVDGIGSIMPLCRDTAEVDGVRSRFADRVRRIIPLYAWSEWDEIRKAGDRISREEGYKVLMDEIAALGKEVDRLRLTDEEREAVEWAIYEGPLRSQAEGAEERAATLRKLLERLA